MLSETEPVQLMLNIQENELFQTHQSHRDLVIYDN